MPPDHKLSSHACTRTRGGMNRGGKTSREEAHARSGGNGDGDGVSPSSQRQSDIHRSRCDIGYIVRHHLTAMMQLLTVELRDYDMCLMTTKCFNTAVMFWYLFLGEDAISSPSHFSSERVRDEDGPDANTSSLSSSHSYPDRGRRMMRGTRTGTATGSHCGDDMRACDSDTVSKRGKEARAACRSLGEWRAHPVNPENVARAFAQALLDDSDPDLESKRVLYYVILTNCEMPSPCPLLRPYGLGGGKGRVRCAEARKQTPAEFFPGHLFLIEKVIGSCGTRNGDSKKSSNTAYNLYQSYVNQYDFAGHESLNKSLSMSEDRARAVASGLVRTLRQDPEHVWDSETTRLWEDLTHVNCANYEGYQFSMQSFMCFASCSTDNCTDRLRALVRTKLSELRLWLLEGRVLHQEVYGGDPSLFASPRPNTHRLKSDGKHTNGIPVPLSNGQMESQLAQILSKL